MKLTIRPSREYFSSATVSYCASTVMPKFDREEPNGFKSNGQLARIDRRRNCRVRGRQGCHGTGLPANESCLRHSGTRSESTQRAGGHPTPESVGTCCELYEPLVDIGQQRRCIYSLQRSGSQA